MINRRQFLSRGMSLTGAIKSFPFTTAFVGQLVQGLIQEAQAAELGGVANTRYYVNLHIGGGPARYTFDQWVKTQSSESIVGNPYVSTAYSSSNGRVTGVEYSTFNYNGTEVPYLFSTQGYNGNGSLRNLSDILNNMLVVRGFGTGFDGHDTNEILVYTPVTGLPNLPGLMADSNNKLFSSVGGKLASLKNKAATHYSGTYLYSLFSAFQKNSLNVKADNLKQLNQSTYDIAMSYLKSFARSERIGSKTLAQNLSNASAKMKQGLSDIDSFWPVAVERYRKAVLTTLRQIGVPRISDIPIIRENSGVPEGLYSVFGMTAPGQFNFMPASDWDIREMIQTLNNSELAEKLAMTEYLLRGDYTPSVNIGISNFEGISLRTQPSGNPVTDTFNQKGQLYYAHTDMDGGTGAMINLLLTHNYYSALVAGILELKDQLNANKRKDTNSNLWNETVFHVTSEFARNCPTNGLFTPHGYNNMVSSAFSGAIQNGPYVVGNIQRDIAGLGTNAHMAPIGGGYPIQGSPGPVMMTSTIAELMRAPSNPWANTAPPLISLNQSSGVITYPFGRGKLVG